MARCGGGAHNETAEAITLWGIGKLLLRARRVGRGLHAPARVEPHRVGTAFAVHAHPWSGAAAVAGDRLRLAPACQSRPESRARRTGVLVIPGGGDVPARSDASRLSRTEDAPGRPEWEHVALTPLAAWEEVRNVTERGFADVEAAVEVRAREGQPLERVEAFIEQQSLPEDAKAALWLLAWSIEQEPWAAHPLRHLTDDIDTVYD